MKSMGPSTSVRLRSVLGAVLIMFTCCATAQVSPCTWAGTSQVTCTGVMSDYDAHSLLDSAFDNAAASGTVAIQLSSVNITGVQLSWARAVAYDATVNPTLIINIENSVISRNQFVLFGALAAQAGVSISLNVQSSQVLGNQMVLATGLVSGAAGRASLNTVNSQVQGNMITTAGALALGSSVDVSAIGTGGAASGNMLAAAGFVASGGAATASGVGLDTVASKANLPLAVGLPFLEEPLTASIISTVMNAVFVDSSTLDIGLANIQAQLCASLSQGGSMDNFAYDLGLSAVRDVAWGVLCDPGSASRIQLSDIPAMLDSGSGPGALGTFSALRKLATGEGHLRIKSLRSALNFARKHPQAVVDLFQALAVKDL